MVLQKLNLQNYIELKDKRIVCYVRVADYIKEIHEKYNLLEQIDFIVDEHSSRWGNCLCEGKEIPVRGPESLKNLNYQTYAIIITSEYYKEVFDTLDQMNLHENGLEKIYYYADREMEIYDSYAQKYRNAPLENIIVFRSGPRNEMMNSRMEFVDNAKALFDHMLRNKYNDKYQFVWIVKNPDDYLPFCKEKNVTFVSYDWATSEDESERDKYYRYLCLAKYIFFTSACNFIRNAREGQIRVELWHGQGFKNRALFSRFEKRYEYMTVMSRTYAEIHAKIFGLRDDQLLITGIPKQDWLFHNISEQEFFDLGIPKASKYIFWLPTFKETTKKLETLGVHVKKTETGFSVLENMEQVEELNSILKERDAVLVIKLHHAQNVDVIADVNMSNIILLKYEALADKHIHINQILDYADALISDYSSVAVDYLLLDRPIGFAVGDFEDYKKNRGFIFDDIENWLPGNMIFEFSEFCNFVDEIAKGIDSSAEKRRAVSAKLCTWKDDHNCERVIEALGIEK